jgi:hypothetical protein
MYTRNNSGPNTVLAVLQKVHQASLTHTFRLAPVVFLNTRKMLSILDSGTVPSDWKEALITPLFKKGEPNVASKYRSVSLTSVVSKILEHIIHSSIMRHINHHNILTDCQHGFRSIVTKFMK